VLKIKMILVTVLITLTGLLAGTGCLVPFGFPPVATAPTVDPATGQASVNQAWSLIQQQYVEPGKIDTLKMSGAAIKGMLDTLYDHYSSYLDPETYNLRYLPSLEGKFDGIGATVSEENQTARVVSTQPGSPAEKAGVKAGDVILAVDGVSVANMSLTEVIVRVRGPRGTTVKLTLRHADGVEPVTLDIVRAEIKLATVRAEMRDYIAVITLSSFADTTDAELTPFLASLASEKATGIVLDVRGNPGGPLQAVVDVVSHFVKPGDLVVDVVEKGKHTPSRAVKTEVTTDLPLVVLVNKDSASASEVLTGALKDYQRATIAGEKTYGKGSVNVMFQLRDGSALYLTVGRWFTPNEQLIEGKGIEPDIPLTVTGDAAISWAVDYLKSGARATATASPEAVYG
jgi:carboxyl-terminal processing protease